MAATKTANSSKEAMGGLDFSQKISPLSSSSSSKQKSLALHLYPKHIRFGDKESIYQYNGPLKGLLDCISRGTIPIDAAEYLPASYMLNGQLVVDVHDHRLGLGTLDPVQRVYLSPTQTSLDADISSFLHKVFIQQQGQGDAQQVTGLNESLSTAPDINAYIDAIAKVLPLIEPLNLDPSISTVRTANLSSYNNSKFHAPPRLTRPRNWMDREAQDSSKKETREQLSFMDPTREKEFYPRFYQSSFVEEWKKKRKLADGEMLISLGVRKMKVAKKLLQYNANRRIIRTLKFESLVGGKKIYTTLNVYDLSNPNTTPGSYVPSSHEAVLRWGEVDGTAINGGTLRYPLGNKTAVEYYIGHFKGFYGLHHKLVSDNAADLTSLSALGMSVGGNFVGGVAGMMKNQTVTPVRKGTK